MATRRNDLRRLTVYELKLVIDLLRMRGRHGAVFANGSAIRVRRIEIHGPNGFRAKFWIDRLWACALFRENRAAPASRVGASDGFELIGRLKKRDR